MAVHDNYEKVDRWNTTTYYPNFHSNVSRITVSNEAIYVDYKIPEVGQNKTHALSEFEALMESIYEEKLANKTHREEEI